MKITCEHCGSTIDVENEKKCSNCGAPYSNNKEYKRKKELDEKERETILRSHEIGNEIVEETFKKFKTVNKVSPVFFIIIFVTIIAIFFIVFRQITNTFNNMSDKITNTQEKNDISTGSFNSELEMFSGNQPGYYVKQLLNTVVQLNNKYSSHTITVYFNNRSITSSDEILKLAKEVVDDEYYNVIFNYDSKGYVSIVNIS